MDTKKRRCSLPPCPPKKRRKAASSSTIQKRRRRRFHAPKYSELNEMRTLDSNDEAFHLSRSAIVGILSIIQSLSTPTPDMYMLWDEYAASFYLKMCICFGVDYQHLEATSMDDCRAESLKRKRKVLKHNKEVNTERCAVNQPNEKEMSYEERLAQLESVEMGFTRPSLLGPFKFGFYSPGTAPERIPYHLYLLVKEAAAVMERYDWPNNTNDLIDLEWIECKISFFCNYFHSHLPPGWTYDRDHASSLVAGYDSTSKPRYSMAGYTPRPIRNPSEFEYDEESNISRQQMIDVMSIIHSRKTPSFWGMGMDEISFYCKICSCFGIEYHCLEAASKDDVCLMNRKRRLVSK